MEKSDLAQFTGSQQFFRHAFNRAVVYTEGIRYVAQEAGAYWLIDAIASHTGSKEFLAAASKDDRIAMMHIWKLAVDLEKHSCELTAFADSGETPFIRQKIEYTDFPLEEIQMYSCHNGEGYTLMLPSEY